MRAHDELIADEIVLSRVESVGHFIDLLQVSAENHDHVSAINSLAYYPTYMQMVASRCSLLNLMTDGPSIRRKRKDASPIEAHVCMSYLKYGMLISQNDLPDI